MFKRKLWPPALVFLALTFGATPAAQSQSPPFPQGGARPGGEPSREDPTGRIREGLPPVPRMPHGEGPSELARLPWNHDLWLAPVTSLEPLRIGEPKVFLERAGVPHVIRDQQRAGRLIAVFQWFPMEEQKRKAFDQVALRISRDDGKTWGEPEPLTIQGMDSQRYQRPMDPTLHQLPDGRFRLYFTSSDRSGIGSGQNRAEPHLASHMRPPGSPPTPHGHTPPVHGRPAIYSAISRDLRTFTFENGTRSAQTEDAVVDPAVTTHARVTFLIAHLGGRRGPYEARQGYFATSRDGLNFERRRNLTTPLSSDFIGNFFTQEGHLFFFGGGPAGIWSIRSNDGSNWEPPVASTVPGGDPTLFLDHHGRTWILYVGPPRADSVGPPTWVPHPSDNRPAR